MNESEVKKLPSKIANRPNNFNETFQSSILTKGQKFMFDKTLVQGIKENDSSKIVQNSEEADLGQANELYDQQKQVNEIFVNTRKKFDHTKETSVRLENNIERLKKEKQIVLAQKTKIQMTFSEQQKEFKRVQQALENLNHLCEAAQYDKDIRLQMVQVLKRDILLYKKNSFDANTKIFRNHSRIKTLYGRFESTKKVSNNCRSLIYSIEKKITEKQTKRFDKLNSYHEIINRKVQNNIKRQERQKMIEVSMLEALNGKMPEEQQQKKLLIANLVLKRMLKLKMEREMQRFNEIETTFRKIKQNTTVKRADEFVQKFIKREKNYGELLESISKNQQKIIKLKQQKQYLEKQNNELLYAKQQIEDKQNEKKSMIKKQMHASIDMLRQKLLNNEFLKNKTFSFVSKFISAFDENNIQIVKGKLSREEPQRSLKQALMRINKFIDSLEREKSEARLKQIYIESKNLNIPENIKNKNMRIKTITAGEQNQDSAIQNYDAAYDDTSQQEFLNQNRKQIKKSTYLRNRIKTRAF